MAKPVLVFDIVPQAQYAGNTEKIIETIKKVTNDEYHVILRLVPDNMKCEIQCFNDCKGLLDVDIEKLITELTEKQCILSQ